MYFYHLTKSTNVESIRKNGLIPHRGNNSQFCAEDAASVFICDESSVKYWSWLLDADVVLKLEMRYPMHLLYYTYGEYSEFLVGETFRPRVLEVTPVPRDVEALRVLQDAYIKAISSLVHNGIRIHRSSDNAQLLNWVKSALGYCQILPRLLYAETDAALLRQYIRDYSNDGEYSFYDCDDITNMSLLETLENLDCRSTAVARDLLCKSIHTYFDKCLPLW